MYLREIRKDKGLTQQDIANIIGLTSRVVSLWEIGKQDMPPRHAKKIAESLNCNWKDLYDD